MGGCAMEVEESISGGTWSTLTVADAWEYSEMIMDGVVGIIFWNIQEVVRYAYMVLYQKISVVAS